MYRTFPVVSTKITVNEIVIREDPASIPQAPKKE